MKKYVIHGGKPLYGKVEISGAKNAAVGIIPAALLVEGICRIENIPQISDVTLMLNILQELGASVRTVNRSTVEVDASAIKQLVSVNRGKASISELEIPKESPLHGKTLGELNMPASSVMISITRDGELIIPRGNTQLLGGDKVMVLCSNDTITQLRKLFML